MGKEKPNSWHYCKRTSRNSFAGSQCLCVNEMSHSYSSESPSFSIWMLCREVSHLSTTACLVFTHTLIPHSPMWWSLGWGRSYCLCPRCVSRRAWASLVIIHKSHTHSSSPIHVPSYYHQTRNQAWKKHLTTCSSPSEFPSLSESSSLDSSGRGMP